MCCRKGGTISIPGVYVGMVDKIPLGAAMNKGLTLKMGQTHMHKYMRPLLERIEKGEIDPSFVITHRLKLTDAPVAYHELGDDDRITRVNKTELAMLGYSAEEMVGKPVQDFIVDDDGGDDILSDSATDLRLETTQRTFRKSDGSTVPVLMRHKLITDASGETRGMRSTLQDISALKHVEHELRQAEEKYRSIFENAIEGIFQTLPEGRFKSSNPALARIYGYDSPEEMIRQLSDIECQLYVDSNRRKEFIQTMEADSRKSHDAA